MTEIHRADPQTRRLAIAAVVIGVVLAAALYGWLDAALRDIASGSDREAARRALAGVVEIFTWAAAFPVALFAVWMWRFGATVRRLARFPPVHARTWRDTVVLRGAQAARRGALLMALAACLLAAAAGLVLTGTRLAQLL